MKKDLIFKVIMIVLALIIGVGSWFNYRAETNMLGAVAMSAVAGVMLLFIAYLYGMIIRAERLYDWKTVGVSYALAILSTVISSLIWV